MKAKITYMWGDEWPTYTVERSEDCRDGVDREAYDLLVEIDELSVQMGKVCVERITD